MVYASAIAESIVAPTLFRSGFSHNLDPDWTCPFRELPMVEPTGVKRKLAVIVAAIVAVSRAVASWQH